MRGRISAFAHAVVALVIAVVTAVTPGLLPGQSSPGLAAAPAAAQDGRTTNSYSDDTFGFDVAWDGDIWQPVDDASTDYLTIETTTTSLYFEGIAYDGSAGDAFAELTDAATIEDGTTLTDWVVAENAEGKPLTGRSGTGVYGVFTYVFTDAGANENANRVAYIEVQPLVEGESVVAITAVTYDMTAYNDDIELVFEVIDTLEVTGEKPRETEEPDPEIDDGIWISRPDPVAS